MRILCAFDKFKDSLSASKVGDSIIKGLQQIGMKGQFRNVPLSDGGEGFLKVLMEPLKLQIKYLTVTGPLGIPIQSMYGYTKNLSVIEMSLVCGLELIPDKGTRNPMYTTTRGVGEMIVDSVKSGRRNILLGIGGSATNDAGIGALEALGLVLKGNYLSNPFIGMDMVNIEDFDTTLLLKCPSEVNIEIACDVLNPFIGKDGAVAVFAQQKGATFADREILEQGMLKVAKLIHQRKGIDVSKVMGAGAAGGIAGGFLGLVNAKLVKGSDLIAKSVDLEHLISESDLVFTGEGCYDDQTDHGKIVSQVIRICQKKKVPYVIVCGANIGHNESNVFDLLSMFEKEESMQNTQHCLIKLIESKKDYFLRVTQPSKLPEI